MLHTSKRKQENYFHGSYYIINLIITVLLLIHLYIFNYLFFENNAFYHSDLNSILLKIANSTLFTNVYLLKAFILFLSIVSLSITKVYKKINVNLNKGLVLSFLGGIVFLFSHHINSINFNPTFNFIVFSFITITSFFIFNYGIGIIYKYFNGNLKKDLFNKEQEAFPQEERLLENNVSVNLPSEYFYKGKMKRSWINFINLFRGLLITGSPGSGKTYFIFRNLIEQLIAKNFTLLVYDYKYPNLTKLTYNLLLKYYDKLPLKPKFYTINFDEPKKSHRVNPLVPEDINDISDAYQLAKSIYFGMGKNTSASKDPFWDESSVNLLTSVIWFLKKVRNGKYCSFPYVIEFIMGDENKYLPLLMCDVQGAKYANVFFSSVVDSNSKLKGNLLASLKQRLAKLASPPVYWVLSGNDFNLDLNNPEDPKILVIANNDQKSHSFSSPLSLIIEKVSKTINVKNKHYCATIFDEFPTVYFENVANQIATARENKVATILGLQDASQSEKNLGKIDSEIIFNITPNIISGSLSGTLAKSLSERLGKIKMVNEGINFNTEGTPTMNKNVRMGEAVPISTINSLSAGEVVGLVADTPEQPISLKRFHCHIINDHAKLKEFDNSQVEIPIINKDIEVDTLENNFYHIEKETRVLIDDLFFEFKNNSDFEHIFGNIEY